MPFAGLGRGAGFWAAVVSLAVLAGCGGGGHSQGDTNPGTPPPTAAVSGMVKFQGKPLAGATVTCYNTNTNVVLTTVQTDDNGAYTIAGLLASGNVPSDDQFWVQKAGYGFYPSVGTGGTVTRMGYNGMFRGNGINDVAISFTVIDYLANAAAPLTTADFNAFTSANAPVSLARTGQGAAYAAGDDGSTQGGIPWPAQRFVDKADGTVLDQLTGLVWLRDAGYFSPATWAQALADVNQLATGRAGLTDGSKAGDWRVPNRKEMQSMADRFMNNHADFFNATFTTWAGAVYQSPIFNTFVPAQFYRTSTTDAADTTQAWTVYSCDFGVYGTVKSQMGYSLAVR